VEGTMAGKPLHTTPSSAASATIDDANDRTNSPTAAALPKKTQRHTTQIPLFPCHIFNTLTGEMEYLVGSKKSKTPDILIY
jgi:hypothetical protein